MYCIADELVVELRLTFEVFDEKVNSAVEAKPSPPDVHVHQLVLVICRVVRVNDVPKLLTSPKPSPNRYPVSLGWQTSTVPSSTVSVKITPVVENDDVMVVNSVEVKAVAAVVDAMDVVRVVTAVAVPDAVVVLVRAEPEVREVVADL